MKRLLTILLAAAADWATACDLCPIATPSLSPNRAGTGLFAGISQQFTHFGTLQEDGTRVANPERERLDSSISQILAGWQFHERASLQFNAPVIHRAFRRRHDMETDSGSESGLGDVSLHAHVQAWRMEGEHHRLNWQIHAGVKAPTGDSDRLSEELEEAHGGMMMGMHEESGIHGHDLALGSGSWDGVFGTEVFAEYKRFFLTGSMQYAVRTEGDFDYRFADDVTWLGGPGWEFWRNDIWTAGLQAVVSGEHKGRDDVEGVKLDDTAITSVFLGPQLLLAWKDQFHFEVGGDLPVSRDNGGLQAVAEYRVRAWLGLRF